MRITEKKENGFYELKKGQEIYGEENGIRLVQIVGEYEDIDTDIAHLAKIKQALEIIKNKGVFVHLLQQSQNVEEYNSLMLIAFKKMAERDYKGAVEKFCLTGEEYDSLKEALE